MPAKWKGGRFKPEVVLARIASQRTLTERGASFSGGTIDETIPLLHSMIKFPEAAKDLDFANLIWKAVAGDRGDLTKDSFLGELNRQISQALSKRDSEFNVLTTISLVSDLGQVKIGDAIIKFYKTDFPKKYRVARSAIVSEQKVPAKESAASLSRVVISVKAKSPSSALHAALRALDIYRALWCLQCNFHMEIMGSSWIPINAVRLGAIHTVHLPTGESAINTVWFEPHHIDPPAYKRPKDEAVVKRNIRTLLGRLGKCPYENDLFEALLLYVRALDEWNQSTALTRLWSAVERLASPGYGDYDAVVRRCAFLWHDVAFAVQALEHLREYRNNYIHHGEESSQSKNYCFILQQYFRPLIYFHINNSGRFDSIPDANEFLDLPHDATDLHNLKKRIAKAQRFRVPRSQLSRDS